MKYTEQKKKKKDFDEKFIYFEERWEKSVRYSRHNTSSDPPVHYENLHNDII